MYKPSQFVGKTCETNSLKEEDAEQAGHRGGEWHQGTTMNFKLNFHGANCPCAGAGMAAPSTQR